MEKGLLQYADLSQVVKLASLVVSVLIIAVGTVIYLAVTTEEPIPIQDATPIETPEFKWHLKDADWTDAKVHVDEALRMLETLDRELHTTTSPEARAGYYNARIATLYHIHIYSDRIKFVEKD